MKTKNRCNDLFFTIALLLFTTFFICSCSNELEDNTPSEENKEFTLKMSVDEANALKIKKTGSYLISEEDALEMVVQGFVDKKPSRTNDDFIVESCRKVELATAEEVENENKPVGYYIVDFKHQDNQGFSIVSADRRLEKVFAFSEKGSLNDTIYNEGLKIFYQGLSLYMEDQIKEFNTDSLYDSALAKLTPSRNWIDDGNFHYYYAPYGFAVDSDYEYMGEEVITYEGENIGNILTTRWSQTSPYNNKLPYVATNQRAYAGCTLIAMLQIMAYHKKAYGSVTAADWTRFTQSSQCYEEELQDCVLSIFNEIEKGYYDTSGTGIGLAAACLFLYNNGYQATFNDSYNSNTMILPVLVSGQNETGTVAHAWVIDSKRINTYVTYDKYEKDDGYDVWRIYVEKLEEYGPLYVHCNWGWGGSSDGWFINNGFSSYNNFNFSHNLKMVNIQP